MTYIQYNENNFINISPIGFIKLIKHDAQNFA